MIQSDFYPSAFLAHFFRLKTRSRHCVLARLIRKTWRDSLELLSRILLGEMEGVKQLPEKIVWLFNGDKTYSAKMRKSALTSRKFGVVVIYLSPSEITKCTRSLQAR